MIKRFIRGFLIVSAIIAGLSILGVAGDSDFKGIEVNQLIFRGGTALIFLITCFVGQALLKEEK